MAGSRKEVKSLETNHSFFISRRNGFSVPNAGGTVLGSLCLEPFCSMSFYMPLSQSFKTMFSHTVILIRP